MAAGALNSVGECEQLIAVKRALNDARIGWRNARSVLRAPHT